MLGWCEFECEQFRWRLSRSNVSELARAKFGDKFAINWWYSQAVGEDKKWKLWHDNKTCEFKAFDLFIL